MSSRSVNPRLFGASPVLIKTTIAVIALLAAPSAFADYVFQFRGVVAGCVSNSGGCEPTDDIFLELTMDPAYFVLGSDINESDTNDPRVLHAFGHYVELNYPPYPPTSTGKHIIWGSTFPTTGNNTPSYALRTVDLPMFVGGTSSVSAVDFSVTNASLPNRTLSLAFVTTENGWSIQVADMNAKSIKYTRYSGKAGRWILVSDKQRAGNISSAGDNAEPAGP